MARNPRRQREKAASHPKLAVYATLVRRSWLRRTIQLSGAADALIEYDARSAGWGHNPQAIVRLGGVEVAWASKFNHAETERIALPLGRHQLGFMLPTRRGPVAASVTGEITGDNGLLIQLKYLQLTVDNVRLYQEGSGQLLIALPPNNPIPAGGPGAETLGHPIPAAADAASFRACEPKLPQPAKHTDTSRDNPWWKRWRRR